MSNKSAQIKLLRQEHQQAIDKFDFDRAEMIESQIKRLRSELSKNTHTASQKIEVNENEERLMAETAKINEDLLKRKVEIQQKYTLRLKEIKERHTNELTALAQQQTNALEREATRPIPEVISILEQSKTCGRNHKYAEAKQLFADANSLKREVLLTRRAQCNAVFDKQRKQLEARQKKEITLLEEKQQGEILALQQEKQYHDAVLTCKRNVKKSEAAKRNTRRAQLMAASPAVKRRSASMSRDPRRPPSRVSSSSRVRNY